MSLGMRLSTVSQSSWHYRLVVRIHKLLSDPVEINSACGYWCGLLPFCLLMAAVLGAAAIAIAACLVFDLEMVAAAVIREPTHSLKVAVLFTAIEASAVAGAFGLILGIGRGVSWVKRRCPLLKIVE